MEGIVKWFKDDLGYGFIAADGRDYFAHFSEISHEGFKSLREGDKVFFNPETAPKGLIARQIQKEFSHD